MQCPPSLNVGCCGIVHPVVDTLYVQSTLRPAKTCYVQNVLAPTLAEGEIAIPDSLGSRKGEPAHNAIRATRATGAHLLFRVSPNLNPIEQVFAKLKYLNPSDRTLLCRRNLAKVNEHIDRLSKQECANYLENSGYVGGGGSTRLTRATLRRPSTLTGTSPSIIAR